MISSLQSDDRAADERRSHYRCRVSGDRRTGRMKIDERELGVEIVDESANGFAVEVDAGQGCEIGQVAFLENASGWTEVRVVNIRPQRSVEANELAGQTSDTRMRLGLVRLQISESSEVEEEQQAAFSWGEVMRTICPLAPLGWVLGVGACLVFGASLIFVLVWTLEQMEASDHMISVGAASRASRWRRISATLRWSSSRNRTAQPRSRPGRGDTLDRRRRSLKRATPRRPLNPYSNRKTRIR